MLLRARMLALPVLLALALSGPGVRPEAASAEAGARDAAARLLGLALAGEPSLEAIQRAAAERAAASRQDAAGWRSRARLSGLLPRLVAEYRHDERNYRVVGLTATSEVDYLRSTPGDTVSVRLDWDLEKLVFVRQELEAEAAAERAEARRTAAAERASRLYHQRLRLKLALLDGPPATARARADLELDLAAVTADLQALTGLYGEPAP